MSFLTKERKNKKKKNDQTGTQASDHAASGRSLYSKQMKSYQECRHTQRAGGTGSSHIFNVRSKRHSFWRDAKGAEPGPMSV